MASGATSGPAWWREQVRCNLLLWAGPSVVTRGEGRQTTGDRTEGEEGFICWSEGAFRWSAADNLPRNGKRRGLTHTHTHTHGIQYLVNKKLRVNLT